VLGCWVLEVLGCWGAGCGRLSGNFTADLAV